MNARVEDYAKPNVISNLDEFSTASISCLRLEWEESSVRTWVLYAKPPAEGLAMNEWSPGRNIFRFQYILLVVAMSLMLAHSFPPQVMELKHIYLTLIKMCISPFPRKIKLGKTSTEMTHRVYQKSIRMRLLRWHFICSAPSLGADTLGYTPQQTINPSTVHDFPASRLLRASGVASSLQCLVTLSWSIYRRGSGRYIQFHLSPGGIFVFHSQNSL